GRSHRARARRAAAPRHRPHEAGDRGAARDLPVHGAHAHGAHLRQVRRVDAGRARDVRDAARARPDAGREDRLNDRWARLRAVPTVMVHPTRGATMSVTDTSASDIAAVRGGFEAFGKGDLAAFADMFHPDATWNHRNPDRLGGVHHGSDGIVAFVTE